MLGQKRKRVAEQDLESLSEDSNGSRTYEEVDISSSLINKRHRTTTEDLDDDELLNFIQKSVSKRDLKDGTQVIKKIKGKSGVAKGEVGGGSFQSMSLHPSLLRSLTLQGYRTPTPIQRISIPALLANPPRDLVGMARTGSGKSLAYLIPLIQRLGGRHSQIFGSRALVLLPTRELALQILKVAKELSRGWHTGHVDHAGDKEGQDNKTGQNLRWGLVVGGEGLDEQFEMIASNPDVIIATPGRLLHLIVEMNLDLKAVQYVVFDEADRLFEMGFETALNEILHRLPASRQTTLFSATLPKSLVEFAKAGLQDPKLVRLDADSKISSDLKMAFFSVKRTEKDACLIALLRDVIHVPPKSAPPTNDVASSENHKSKRKDGRFAASHQTIIFTATKHHVEYLTALLETAGYATSHIYGSLDQAARSFQMSQFRYGATSILVVTDVAARGIDIPILENVINFDFPQGARVFVHRVGRTARAGRQGWAWSFVTNDDLPYLIDLQLFLGRPLKCEVSEAGDEVYTKTLVLGTFQREKIDADVEYVRSLDSANHSLPTLREVMKRGQAMYERSKGKASPQSYKRSKEMTKDPKWMLAGSDSGIHPVLLRGDNSQQLYKQQEARKKLLDTIKTFTPSETVFETVSKGNAENAALMKERRKALYKSAQRSALVASTAVSDEPTKNEDITDKAIEMADESEITAVFDTSKQGFRDEAFYMSYYQKDAITEKGYSLTDGASSFVKQAQDVTFDIVGDEGSANKKNRQLNWDKKKKKFVKGDGIGADNVKMVKTENGTKLPASYRSGRFDEWKVKSRVSLPRTGEMENNAIQRRQPVGIGGRRFKHTQATPAKPLDKLRHDYDRKTRQLKQRDSKVEAESSKPTEQVGKKGRVLGRRYGGKSYGRVKTELKTSEQIRKSRQNVEKKRAKNARSGKNRKGKR